MVRTMHCKRFAGALIALFFLAPLPALASTQTILQDDLDSWDQSHTYDSGVMTEEEEEWLWQVSEELYPAIAVPAEPASPIEEQRLARIKGILTVEVGGKRIPFRDVPDDAWFMPYVRSVLESGIMSGYGDALGRPTGQFGPANNVTVEELSKIAVNLSGGIKTDCPATSINKTATGSWSMPYVACAEKRGWSIYSDGTVNLLATATRGQVVVTLLQAYDVVWGERSGTAFTDVTESTEFAGAIERAKADGLVSGYGDANGKPTGMFGPNDPVTRAELAKMVAGAMELYGR